MDKEQKNKARQKIVFTRGIPCSGKSTWAKERVRTGQGKWKRINKDSLRLMVDDGRWSKNKEKFIVHLRNTFIREALSKGFNVVVDDTNLKGGHVEDIKKLIHIFGPTNVDVEEKWFPIHVEDAIELDKRRRYSVGEKVIRRMWDQYVECGGPLPTERVKINRTEKEEGLPYCIICDLDGTLSLLNGRDPYDASTCDEDKVCESVMGILYSLGRHINIILVSGREDKFRPQTLSFLSNNDIQFDELYMRKEGDLRKDTIIKEEIYYKYIKDRYSVLFVMDDRTRIVEMWRMLGLKTLQVDWGEF